MASRSHSQILQCHVLEQIVCIFRRYKKRYASFHNQDRKAYVFPNTPDYRVLLPCGIKVCAKLDEFKIKNLKGGFRRRPELICLRGDSSHGSTRARHANVIKSTKKVERIQSELVAAALRLVQDIKFVSKVSPSLTSGVDGQSEVMQYVINDDNLPLIIDIGCGSGHSLKPLIGEGYSCIGVDLDLSSLQQANSGDLLPSIESRKSVTFDWGDSLLPASKDQARVYVTSYANNEQTNVLKEGVIECNHFHQSCPDKSRRLLTHKPMQAAADVVRWDLRHGLPFKRNSFDLAISISFLQWLFYGNPQKQLDTFFAALKSILCPGGRAVLQFYPQNKAQLESAVMYALPYFHGVVVGDYPHLDRGRKIFLILFHLDTESVHKIKAS